MKIFRNLLVLFILAVVLLAPSSAAAHRPDWGSGSRITQIENISVSYAFYRELTSADDAHAYVFTAAAGQQLHAGISIPAIDRLKDYNVYLALFGPGLAGTPEDLHDLLPETHPEGGSVLLVEPGASEDYSEPFTQTHYWGRQVLEINLPESGEYTLLVWNPNGAPGKYVLDTGREEAFGLSDALRMPVWWVRARLYFEQGGVLALLGVGLLALMAAFVWRRTRLSFG